jgi:hypothetical protein
MPPAWRGHNFRDKEATAARCSTTEVQSAQGAGADPWFNAQRGDPESPASLWLAPTDLVFLKTNARYPKATLDAYEQWQLASRPSVVIKGLASESSAWARRKPRRAGQTRRGVRLLRLGARRRRQRRRLARESCGWKAWLGLVWEEQL